MCAMYVVHICHHLTAESCPKYVSLKQRCTHIFVTGNITLEVNLCSDPDIKIIDLRSNGVGKFQQFCFWPDFDLEGSSTK